MQSLNQLQGELVHLVSEYMALRFTIPPLGITEDPTDSGVYGIFAVDKSGSMAGGPMRDARGASESLATKFRRKDIPTSLFLFDDHCEELSSDTVGYDRLVERLQEVKAGGGTDFTNVINAISAKVQEKDLKNVFCVWLTDGQDKGHEGGLQRLMPLLEMFQQTFEANGVSIAVHCIGFSGDHDAELLTRLSESGTRPGTFQYIPYGGRIPVAVNNVYELAFVSAVWARFIGSEHTYKVGIEHFEGDTLKALVYVSEDDLEECKVEIHQGKNVVEVAIEPERRDVKDFRDLVRLVTNFVASKIALALTGTAEGSAARLEALRTLVTETDRRLGDLHAESTLLGPYRSKALQAYFDATQELSKAYFEVLGQGDLTNVQLAHLNSLANKVVLKKSLEQKILKETGENMELLFESDDNIRQTASTLDQARLQALDGELGLKCALSGKPTSALLASGDCLCASFCIERPQNLMGDPYDLKIRAVNTALMSHDSFVNSIFFETKAGQMIQGPKSYQHGTVPEDAGRLIPGMPAEKINALLPLYLAEEHWAVAKHRLPAMIGYGITVDVLGFKKEQLHAFPYFLMAHSLARKESQASGLVFARIRETCQHIYRLEKAVLLPKLQGIVEGGVKAPEVYGHIGALCCLVHCASAESDIGDIKGVLPLFLEEAVRKHYPNPEQKLHELSLKLLDIDMTPHTEPVRHALLDAKTSFAERFRMIKSGGSVQEAGDNAGKVEDVQVQLFEFTGRLDSLSAAAEAELSKVLNAMGNVESELGCTAKALQLLGLEVKHLEGLGLRTVEQKLAFVLQAQLHNRNSDRAAAVEEKSWANPFDEEEAVRYVQKVYSEVVNREVMSFKSNLLNQLQGKEAEQRVAVFAHSEDLEEAAGAVYGVSIGQSYFSNFFKSLIDANVKHPLEKAKMLTHGHFQGVKLVVDKKKDNPEFVTWNPNNKSVFKLWTLHFNQGSFEDWVVVFPQKKEYFEHQYSRKHGDFVPYSNPRGNCIDPRHWEGKPEQVKKRQKDRNAQQPANRDQPPVDQDSDDGEWEDYDPRDFE